MSVVYMYTHSQRVSKTQPSTLEMYLRCKAWFFPSRKDIIKLIFVIGSMAVLKICLEWKHSSASKHADVSKEVNVVPLEFSSRQDPGFYKRGGHFVRAKSRPSKTKKAKLRRGSGREEAMLREISSKLSIKKNNVSREFHKNEKRNLQLGMAERCDKLHRMVQNIQTTEQLVRSLRNIFVLDEKKLLFCYVPKIACTNWKRILLILKATVDHMSIHQLADENLPILSTYKVNDALRRIKEYKKLLFVREPFSRLLSAYRDKLEKSGRVDSDRFRKDWSASMKSFSRVRDPKDDVTFLEYINYLADPLHPINQPKDEHWNPIYQLCRPCDVQYDFIGRMENLERDSEYVLKHVIDSDLKLNLHNSTNFTNSSSADIVRQYYSQIPVQTVMQLYKKYRPDFELFSYPFPWFAFNRSSFED
ncbi:Carbohydrate sulfotransferase 11 [Holothuria leucospilota]|uniref:Carbohydrate sulfotransferase n=1 Tax=Holothuria leucospilota TaxID=206669 RepID=A0A9Q1BID8_HOLLE|nr:Carbohydrate sulfotransferase 11 [Holothuria leucospilota]